MQCSRSFSLRAWGRRSFTAHSLAISRPSGGAVAAAAVSITNKETNFTRQTSTDTMGAYRFVDLPAGTYDLRVEASGFAIVSRTGLPVTINNITRADVKVELRDGSFRRFGNRRGTGAAG